MENIMLTKISQNKRINIVWFHLYKISRKGTFIVTESRLEVGRDKGSGELLLNGHRVSVWGDEDVLELDSNDSNRLCEYTVNHWCTHLKIVNIFICELYLN